MLNNLVRLRSASTISSVTRRSLRLLTTSSSVKDMIDVPCFDTVGRMIAIHHHHHHHHHHHRYFSSGLSSNATTRTTIARVSTSSISQCCNSSGISMSSDGAGRLTGTERR